MVCAASPVRSGHAGAEWLAVSASCEPGATLQTAVRLTIDPGWHTYWSNPGEGGTPPSIVWRLPKGWSAGELSHPVPVRMKTGKLSGFGHQGTVWFPVKLTAPADFNGTVKLEAELSWLTCDDSACIPGDAMLALEVTSGPARPGPDEAAIIAALKSIPKPLRGGLFLTVRDTGVGLQLVIRPPNGETRDLSAFQVFPETPQVVDPAALIRFTRDGTGWSAEVARSEYLNGPPKELSLVLADPKGGAAFQLQWSQR